MFELVYVFECSAKTVYVYYFTYFLDNEPRSFSFLLGHLLHFHSLCELFTKRQMCLQRRRKSYDIFGIESMLCIEKT